MPLPDDRLERIIFVTRRFGELRGLVSSLTERPRDHALAWYQKPATLAVLVLAFTLILNIVFF